MPGKQADEAALERIAAASSGPDGPRPIVIAGPTASGKSALALAVADRLGGEIVNADALQVWACWRVLTARPDPTDEARAPHHLYGHVAPGQAYSVGHWLREVAGLLLRLRDRGARPVFVGGTGLYLSALTEGLADIPPIPADVREDARLRLAARGLDALLADLDADTAARIDRLNPARVLRAWEVQAATGEGLAAWQDRTGPALVPAASAALFYLDAPRDWLASRIDARFAAMMQEGAVREVQSVLPFWDAGAPWAQAIGAREIVAHLAGETDIETAIRLGRAATRQYAKRQRTWLRARMKAWTALSAGGQAG